MIKHCCSECGEIKHCEKSWMGPNRWVWTCWDCLEDDEDGYAVMLG